MDMCYLVCAYRTPSGYCGSTGGAATCPHRQKKKTNADRIRAMSDEALAGVDNVHPHRFRRTLATNLIAHGMQLPEVAAILGHDKIDTTMTYVCLDQRNVEASYRRLA